MKYQYFPKTAIASLVLLCGLLPTSLLAQQINDTNVPLTKQGSAAFMLSVNGPQSFGFTGPSAIGSGDPSVIAGAGMKYFFSDRLAARILLNFTTSSSGPDSAQTTSTGYGIALGLEYHCHDFYSISPYFGGGIAFGMTDLKSPFDTTVEVAQKSRFSPQATSSNTLETKFTSFGVSAIGGFDWFFTHSMAVGAEMSFGFASISSSTTVGSTTVNNPGKTQLGFASVSNIHFIVYF